MGYIIGIDVGGTFTDLLFMNPETKEQIINKSPTTVHDPSIGVINGLQGFADKLQLSVSELLARTDLIVHGTTVTTNAVLTNTGAKTALLTTLGFRDVLHMRRGVRSRENLFNNKYVAPPALVPRELRFTVNERMNKQGEILKEVNEEEIIHVIERLKEEGIEAVAISFMHAYANTENEDKVKKLVEEHMPEAFVTTSTEVAPIIRFYNRTSTAVMNAYTGPILKKYITNLVNKLEEREFNGTLLIMQSNGGVNNAETIKKQPATTLLSGPAAGPVAGGTFAKASGYDHALVVDMGGTSFETSIVRDGNVTITKEGEINRNIISLPMAEIHTIGSGGGSIAYLDDGGFLKVGPKSAGASPGPVCYDKGGTEPTTSDANLLLGYLNSDYFLGGQMKLNKEAAEKAIDEKIARPLGISVEEAAYGIFSISNLNMANGIKKVTVEKGYDPREFPLVVAGGAGPIHAAMIAHELGIKEIIIPRFSSVLCAVGMLSSKLSHDYLKSFHTNWNNIERKDLYEAVREEIADGRNMLSAEGVPVHEQIIKVGLDLRYKGQHFEVTVEIDEALLLDGDKAQIEQLFHEEHRRLYGFDMESHEIELINIRVSCQGKHTEFSIQEIPPANGSTEKYLKNRRSVYDPILKRFVETPIYDGEEMGAGCKIVGPAVIELVTTTIVVPYQFEVVTESNGNFLLTYKGVENDGSNTRIGHIQSTQINL